MAAPSIAILILAHKNQTQLSRLIEHLRTNFSIYVHLDLRSKFEVKSKKNVQIISKYKVYYGSYYQILATRELMNTAASDSHDRYLLISGQDLPIVSNQEIIEYFCDNQLNYLSGDKLPAYYWIGYFSEEFKDGGFERLLYYRFAKREDNNYINKFLWPVERLTHKLQDSIKFYRKIPNNLYGGWEWFNLTHEAVLLCLEKLYDPKFMRSFKYTVHGNEIIMPTIMYTSKLLSLCVNDSLRYVDLNYDAFHHNVITMKDFDKLRLSGKLFARKFDDTVDSEIIEKIYEMIK
jgi:hypothetical protein